MTGLPGFVYRMTSYQVEDVADVDPAFGIQLQHPRFLECIRAPELAQLLGRSPVEWVRMMNRQDDMAAALELQRDAGLMASNLQVLDQYVMSLNRMSSEVLRLAFDPEVFLAHVVNVAAPVPRVHSVATQMAAMGLWQPPIGPEWSRAVHGVILQWLFGLQRLFPGTVRIKDWHSPLLCEHGHSIVYNSVYRMDGS